MSEIHQLLPWYVNRTLDDGERATFEAHLAGCSACQAEFKILEELQKSLENEGPAFLAGLIGLPALYALTLGAPEITVTTSAPLVLIGGLLVGFGTSLGSGCTSGHGVCGLSRLSPRSLVATGVFMATAAAVVFVMRHQIGGA